MGALSLGGAAAIEGVDTCRGSSTEPARRATNSPTTQRLGRIEPLIDDPFWRETGRGDYRVEPGGGQTPRCAPQVLSAKVSPARTSRAHVSRRGGPLHGQQAVAGDPAARADR